MNQLFTKNVLVALHNFETHEKYLSAGENDLTKGKIFEGVIGGRLVTKQYSDYRFVRFFQAIGDFFNFFNIINGVSYNQKKIDAVVKKMKDSLTNPAMKETFEKILRLDPNSKFARLESDITYYQSSINRYLLELDKSAAFTIKVQEAHEKALIALESTKEAQKNTQAELESKVKELEDLKLKVATANMFPLNYYKIDI